MTVLPIMRATLMLTCVCSTLFFSQLSVAKMKDKINIDVNAEYSRVCYFKNESYSEGAIITIESQALQCVPSNKIELNGTLKWQVMNGESSNKTTSDSHYKITIK